MPGSLNICEDGGHTETQLAGAGILACAGDMGAGMLVATLATVWAVGPLVPALLLDANTAIADAEVIMRPGRRAGSYLMLCLPEN
jgi:hypothetical protein